jgi:phage shock protein E
MISFIKNIFTGGSQTDYKELKKNGAIILDVRSKGEYQGGHIKDSINIPLDTLGTQISKLDKNKAIITCCASGMRSSSAKSLLESKGFLQVFNGGGWSSLNGKLG